MHSICEISSVMSTRGTRTLSAGSNSWRRFRGRPYLVPVSILLASSVLSSCDGTQIVSGSPTTLPRSEIASLPAEAFSNVNWDQLVLPGQGPIPSASMNAPCGMEPLGRIYGTSESNYILYLSPGGGRDFAVVASACAVYNLNAGVVLFIYESNRTSQPTLVEVAYDGVAPAPSDITSAAPTMSVFAAGVEGYFQYKSLSVLGDGTGFVVDGMTYGPGGQSTPVALSKLVRASLTFGWNGTRFAFQSASGVASPTT